MPNEAEIEKLVRRFGAMRDVAGRAVRENPNDERALYGAAMAYRISGDYASALTQLQNLVRVNGAHTHYLFELGQTLEYMGRFDEAVAQFQQTLRLQPDNAQARKFLEQAQALKSREP